MRALTFGTFDLLHEGHRFVLSEAAARGDLTVVVARDATVERIKGRAPVDGEALRVANVRGVVPSADVFLGDASDFRAPLREVRPDLILLGYDQRLPPGVTEENLSCLVERLSAYKPDIYKTSILRAKTGI